MNRVKMTNQDGMTQVRQLTDAQLAEVRTTWGGKIEIIASLEGREFTVTEILPIEAKLEGLRADLVKRGFHPQTYVLTGKRGAVVMALKSIAHGEFSRLY